MHWCFLCIRWNWNFNKLLPQHIFEGFASICPSSWIIYLNSWIQLVLNAITSCLHLNQSDLTRTLSVIVASFFSQKKSRVICLALLCLIIININEPPTVLREKYLSFLNNWNNIKGCFSPLTSLLFPVHWVACVLKYCCLWHHFVRLCREFVNCVRCIKILSPQEVQQMSLNGDFGNPVLPNQACSSSDNGNAWSKTKMLTNSSTLGTLILFVDSVHRFLYGVLLCFIWVFNGFPSLRKWQAEQEISSNLVKTKVVLWQFFLSQL